MDLELAFDFIFTNYYLLKKYRKWSESGDMICYVEVHCMVHVE